MDPRASSSLPHWPDRYRQIVVGLRSRPQGLPRGPFGALQARLAPVHRSRPGARRRPSSDNRGGNALASPPNVPGKTEVTGMLENLSGETRLFPIIGDPIIFVKIPPRLTGDLEARGDNAICVPLQLPET